VYPLSSLISFIPLCTDTVRQPSLCGTYSIKDFQDLRESVLGSANVMYLRGNLLVLLLLLLPCSTWAEGVHVNRQRFEWKIVLRGGGDHLQGTYLDELLDSSESGSTEMSSRMDSALAQPATQACTPAVAASAKATPGKKQGDECGEHASPPLSWPTEQSASSMAGEPASAPASSAVEDQGEAVVENAGE